MLRRDYIQRMIEEYARVIEQALGLNDEGQRDEALKLLRQGTQSFFNLDPQLISVLAPSQLLMRLVKQDGLTAAQVEIFAQGLRLEADLLLNSKPGEAKDRYIKSLALFEYVEREDSANFSISRRNAIEELMYSISAL